MLTGYKTKVNVGIAAAYIFWITAFVLLRLARPDMQALGIVLWIASAGVFMLVFSYYARANGHTAWWGVLAGLIVLFGSAYGALIGLFLMLLLKSRTKVEKAAVVASPTETIASVNVETKYQWTTGDCIVFAAAVLITLAVIAFLIAYVF